MLNSYLQLYPNRNAAYTLKEGFDCGFKLHFAGPRYPRESTNLLSAHQNHDILVSKLQLEVDAGRMVGPFKSKPISNLRVSPVGLVPKKTGGWRLIQNLSYPEGDSVNSFIDEALTSVHYTSFDQAMSMVQKLGRGALLGKKDIKSAFRLLPIFPGDFDLLGIKVGEDYYVDKCLPMGCSISCAAFEKFSTFLEWIVRIKCNSTSIEHYLDDFLFGGRANDNACIEAMNIFDSVCQDLGVPVADEKTEGPVTCLVFLGLEIDTLEQVVRIPRVKVEEITLVLKDLLDKTKVQLKDLQSLLGKLAFCVKAMPGARAFSRRLYSLLAGASRPHHFIRLTKGVKDDIGVWLEFFQNFNGTFHFFDQDWVSSTDLELFTDSTGNPDLGCGAVFGKHWFAFKWPNSWQGSGLMKDITFLELVPIVMALYVWQNEFRNKKILLHCDNQALVEILNSSTSRSDHVMSFIRPLILHCLRSNIQIRARHVRGKDNSIADALSRFQWYRFRELAPQADRHPAVIPQVFWNSFRASLMI